MLDELDNKYLSHYSLLELEVIVKKETPFGSYTYAAIHSNDSALKLYPSRKVWHPPQLLPEISPNKPLKKPTRKDPEEP